MGYSVRSPLVANDAERRINTKGKILIVEDNAINQEILIDILEDKYDIITAENGAVGLELLKKHYHELSLIMLDVYMPICNGFEFLEAVKDDALLATVPVIVTTSSSDPSDEIKCLRMGAYDFVTKPYNAEIVKVRVEHIIKLKESVATLSVVEYDRLTGLFTMEAFIHRVQKTLSRNTKKQFDLLLADIQDFKLVNDSFGEDVGDEALVEVAKSCRNFIPFYFAAREGDKFYFLCDNVADIEQGFVDVIGNEVSANLMISALNIKYAVYRNIDPNVSVSILCDRLNMAIESIKHSYNSDIVYYDESMRKKMLDNQKLEADFAPALHNGEFHAWYQPKVDSRTGKIVAAEALVRWIPEEGKMISPAAFIPLFERNGQIADLDEYIFGQVCAFQKSRLDKGQRVVPISVNLSRNSVYKNEIVKRYFDIASSYEVPLDLVPLELTESATTESKLMQGFVSQANEVGFSVHMDDFGTGYSSISALARLSFSAIKLDKSLIDQIGYEKGDVLMKFLVGAAHAIGMEVVAEGVEEQSQVEFLKTVGCNIIQGYYYSPPKSLEIFEKMLDTDEPLGPKF